MEMPEGHGVMDNALACHAGGRGSNPDKTKNFSVSEKFKNVLPSTRVPVMGTLSLTMPVVACFSMNTCHGGGKRRGIMEKP